MLKVECLPEGKPGTDGAYCYPWSIDTRYYTANIHLCSTDVRTIGDAEFAANVQAFIVHFDTNNEESFAQVKWWLPFLEQIEPEIQLLICDTCRQGDAVSKEEAWKWCLENSFELIELQPESSENSDEEDDFQETVGVDRIIQALHAHSWPNLIMKEKPSYRSSLMTQMMRDEAKQKRELNEQETVDNDLKTSLQDHPSSTVSTEKEEQLPDADTESQGANFTTNENQEHLNSGRDHSKTHVHNLSDPAIQNENIPEIWGKAEALVDQGGFENNFVDGETSLNADIKKSADSKLKDSKTSDGWTDREKSSSQASCDTEGRHTLDSETSAMSGDSNKETKDGGIESLMGNEELQMLTALGDSDHLDADSFEKLFDKLRVMKEQAESLPLEQRKHYAEKVAVEFWKAIGGEDEEIDGLSSDEDFTL